jgi:hypothetical protein
VARRIVAAAAAADEAGQPVKQQTESRGSVVKRQVCVLGRAAPLHWSVEAYRSPGARGQSARCHHRQGVESINTRPPKLLVNHCVTDWATRARALAETAPILRRSQPCPELLPLLLHSPSLCRFRMRSAMGCAPAVDSRRCTSAAVHSGQRRAPVPSSGAAYQLEQLHLRCECVSTPAEERGLGAAATCWRLAS